jgi:hypothetical protein
LNGQITYTELAQKCGLQENNLRRIIRYAIAYHRVFLEPEQDFVAHSAASRLLVDDPTAFDTLGMMFDESWQAFARVCVCSNKGFFPPFPKLLTRITDL